MAGTWEITDGQTTRRVTQEQYAEMVKDRPAYLPKITVLSKGKMRAVYENSEGDMVDELVDPEQIEHRAKYGDDISATPESIERARQDSQRRTTEAMADEEDFTTFVNAALPGAQYIQNAAVGVDAATKARQELNRNVMANLTGNLVEYAVGSKALSLGFKGLLGAERAGKVGTTLGFANESSLLAKAGRLAGEDVAISTHFYKQQLLDNNEEFVAEDWAQQVGVGLLLAAPLIGGGIARAGAASALKVAGPGAASKLSSLGDAMTTSALIAEARGGVSMGARKQVASAAHIAARTMRKLTPKSKGRALSGTDELLAKQAAHLDDMSHAGGMTPERLARMTPTKRTAAVARYKAMADGDTSWIDGINWKQVSRDIGDMKSQTKAVRKQTLGIHRRFRGEGNGAKMSQKGYTAALVEANALLKHVDDVGMSDVKGALQRGIIEGGDAAGLQHAMFEARINARFRRGLDGGADIVDDRLRAFTQDTKHWGARQAAKNTKINDALDEVVDVWDSLGDMVSMKELEALELGDGLKLGNQQGKLKQLRDAMNVLTDMKLLTDDQIRGIETKLIEVSDAQARGTRAAADVIKLNNSRRAVSKRMNDQADLIGVDVPTTQEGFAATRDAMVGETAGRLMEMGENVASALAKGINWTTDVKRTVPAIRGVAGLPYLSVEEKTATFTEIQKELPRLTGNPAYAMRKLEPLLDRGAAHDPVGANLAGAKITNTMYWLASQMPKPDNTIYGRQVPQPYSMQEEYLEKHFAAYDPISVAYAAIAGRVTPGMVAAVRVTAPAMYAQMGSIMAEQLSKVEATKADPRVVQGISQFMGNLDPMYTGDFIMRLQSTYAQTATQDGVIQGGAANMPRVPSQNSGNSPLTTSQRQQTN